MKHHGITRRDFVKSAGCAAVGLAAAWPALSAIDQTAPMAKSRVVLVRDEKAVDDKGQINADIIRSMVDDAVKALFGKDDPIACFRQLFAPTDVVGIKTNAWGPLPTPPELEQALKRRVMDAGVPEANIDIADRGVLDRPVFQKANALINARPMRTHAWSGVGSLIKNYIMFVPEPSAYHDNACATLGAIWQLPAVKDKTRLNILVMLTPLFHGVGPHHFDPTYVWPYRGLLVGTDPVAVDSVGLHLLQLKRRQYFGEDQAMKPTAHHIALADTRYHLGISDLNRIDLVHLGWTQDSLI